MEIEDWEAIERNAEFLKKNENFYLSYLSRKHNIQLKLIIDTD
jgi:hypothetical protein